MHAFNWLNWIVSVLSCSKQEGWHASAAHFGVQTDAFDASSNMLPYWSDHVWAVRLLLGHTTMDSNVRSLGVALVVALAIAEAIELLRQRVVFMGGPSI